METAVTIWSKHMKKFMSNSMEMFGMAIQPVLWVVLFGVGMKNGLASSMPSVGNNYITFMLPGIIALSALGGAIGGGSVWLTERLRGIIKEYLVAPIPRIGILLGNTLSTTTKSLFQAMLIFLVGLLMGVKLSPNALGWLGSLLLIAGFGLGFSGIALAMASSTNSPGAYHSMIMILNLPLLLLSNALYPLKSLPVWMRIGALINPTSYMVDGVRQLLFPIGEMAIGGSLLPLWQCMLITALFAFLGIVLAYKAFKQSIN